MATKGRTTAGGSGINASGRMIGREEVFVAGDAITQIDVWVDIESTSRDVQGAIYNSSGSRVALGSTVASGVGLNRVTSTITYSVPSSGTYTIAADCLTGAGSEAWRYDALGAVSHYDADASEGSTPPATWTGFVADVGTDDVSISCEYTPAASGNANLFAGKFGSPFVGKL